MRPKLIFVALALAFAPAVAGQAPAQMFGNRTMGRAATPRDRQSPGNRPSLVNRASSGSPSSSAAGSPLAGVGTLDPAARYVRGNRAATDFVGTDSGDVQSFVGARQADSDATGQIQSAVTDLPVQTGPDANRGQAASTQPSAGMYRPRLKIDFDFAPQPAGVVNWELARRLESSLRVSRSGRIEVSVEGEKAILRGEVASERDRRLARLLLLLEPGISAVQNDLVVSPARPTPEADAPTEPALRP